MKRAIGCFWGCILALEGGGAGTGLHAAEILRGPYLQIPTSVGITIRWRTDIPTESVVFYGLQTNNLLFSASNLTPTNEHIVPLLNLTPATIYYYSVGSTTQTLAAGIDYRFVTGPTKGNAGPTRVWAIGDSGALSLGATNVLTVRDSYLRFAGDRRTDVWLVLGDNAYLDGTDPEYQTNFFDVFAGLLRQVSPWPTIGNHDVSSVSVGERFPYLDIFSLPTNGEAGGVPSDSDHYYSFDHANIHFVCLDSQTQSRATNGMMAQWLRADLAATTNQWIIAYWHHPPYSKGSHDSDAPYETEMVTMRQNILPILEQGGVDLILNGHSHNYERSYLLHGHYGSSTNLNPGMILDQGSGRENDTGVYIKPVSGPIANLGSVYVVAGTGCDVQPRIGHHPAIFTDASRFGSLVLDVISNRLDGMFLTETGTIADSFTILKSDHAPLRLCPLVLQNGKIVNRWKSIPGRSYLLERTENRQSPAWQPASDLITAVGATTSWTNDIPPGVAGNFYRVTELRH